MGDKSLEMEYFEENCHQEEIQEEVILANPIENESSEDISITERTDTESMAREIITPSSHKAAVWKFWISERQ